MSIAVKICGVKTADALERVFAHGEIAARQMLGFLVVEQDEHPEPARRRRSPPGA